MTMLLPLCAIRLRLGLSQAALADRLAVSVESLRAWDCGRRPAPPNVLARAQQMTQDPDEQLVPLRELAAVFKVHVRTLRAAARDGRLRATFLNQSFFGYPVALATRRSVQRFLAFGYGKSPQSLAIKPVLTSVPSDCAARIVGIRLRLGLTQVALARRVVQVFLGLVANLCRQAGDQRAMQRRVFC